MLMCDKKFARILFITKGINEPCTVAVVTEKSATFAYVYRIRLGICKACDDTCSNNSPNITPISIMRQTPAARLILEDGTIFAAIRLAMTLPGRPAKWCSIPP